MIHANTYISISISPGDKAVVLFNSGLRNATVSVAWSELGWDTGTGTGTVAVAVRDLWARSDLGDFEGEYKRVIAPRDVAYLRLKRKTNTHTSINQL